MGANLDVDVSFQWMRFFCDDDDVLSKMEAEYGPGPVRDGIVFFPSILPMTTTCCKPKCPDWLAQMEPNTAWSLLVMMFLAG